MFSVKGEKQMKKKSFLLPILLCFVAVLGIVLSGCEEKEISYSLVVSGGEDIVYYVGDDFDLNGYSIALESDNPGKAIRLNLADVIVQMPDMSTSGEKTIKIKYDGKTYSFNINVASLDQKKADIKVKLNDFLSKYLINKKAGDVKLSLSTVELALMNPFQEH